MDNRTCSYEGCKEPVNSPHDDTLCVFHARQGKQWLTVNDRILFIPFKRKYIIPEENTLDNPGPNPESFVSYEDVASLYRRMKTALDRTKDYQQASWFYFNEFEMKRKALEQEIESDPSKIRQILKKLFSKYIFYFSYKVFAGFGEKPLWSFYWLLLGILGFSGLNSLVGLQKGIALPDGKIVFRDAGFLDSLIFTLYRIIPANYLPFKQAYNIPNGFWGLFVPFLNTFVLIIFIAFIAIGLKRHFRRF